MRGLTKKTCYCWNRPVLSFDWNRIVHQSVMYRHYSEIPGSFKRVVTCFQARFRQVSLNKQNDMWTLSFSFPRSDVDNAKTYIISTIFIDHVGFSRLIPVWKEVSMLIENTIDTINSYLEAYLNSPEGKDRESHGCGYEFSHLQDSMCSQQRSKNDLSHRHW